MKKKTLVVGCIALSVVVVLVAPLAVLWIAEKYRHARVEQFIHPEPPAHKLPKPIDEGDDAGASPPATPGISGTASEALQRRVDAIERAGTRRSVQASSGSAELGERMGLDPALD